MSENKNVLFSKTFRRNSLGEDEDTMSISMECDDELGIELSIPIQVVTYEALSTPSPFLVVTFLDGRGDLMNAKKLDTGATYRLVMGSYDESVIESEWTLSHIQHHTSSGMSNNGTFSLHFVHTTWKEFAYNTHCRGWAETSYSDIVSEIAEECGLDITDVIATDGTPEHVQQPTWTNAKMIKWIMERCYPSDGSGEYEYSISIEGNFVFAPFSSFINQDFLIRDSSSGDPIEIFVGGHPRGDRRKDFIKNNERSQFTATSYSVIEQSNSYHRQGAGGVVNSWYDYDEAEYHREEFKYSDSSNIQLSEWSAVNEEYETCPLHLHHGRNSDEAENIGENRICSVVNGMTQVRVLVPTSTILRVGEVVDLIIDVPDESKEDQGQKNEIHSGRYVIGSVSNNFRSGSKNRAESFMTELLLVRQGNDKKESNYYTKSSGGKA